MLRWTPRRHLLRARRRRHDPQRAARLRRHGRPVFAINSARSASSPRSTPKGSGADFDARSRATSSGSPARHRGRAPRRELARSTTSPSTASPASASPTSPTASAATRSGACAATGWSSPPRQGSTGYNLANGGPVLAWGVRGFVVSFIAPHSLTARALVVAPDDRADDPQSLAGGAGRRDRRRAAGLRAAAGREARGAVRHGRRRWPSSLDVLLSSPAPEVRPSGQPAVAPGALGHLPVGGPRPALIAGLRARPREEERALPSEVVCQARLVDQRPLLYELRVENLLLMERAESCS